jgi:cytochrome c peroxidase
VLSVLTIVASDGTSLSQTFPGVLPVDVALSPDGSTTAVVAPGNAFVHQMAKLFLLPGGASQTLDDNAQPIAVAFDAANHVLVQEREPAQLRLLNLPGGDSLALITLSSISRDDTGHDVFHTQAGGRIACASCHPEGGDDGHIWILDEQLRRTPSLRGTVAGTAPYHWPGDMADLSALVDDVYTRRMSGASLAGDQMSALQSWVRTIPAPPAPTWVDSSAARRGLALFNRSDVACATCHSGPKLTNNATVDVGTGGRFQVPPLVGVGWRTPLLHDGCAASIKDRFGHCGSPTHGSTASLTAQDVTDLTAYLETL